MSLRGWTVRWCLSAGGGAGAQRGTGTCQGPYTCSFVQQIFIEYLPLCQVPQKLMERRGTDNQQTAKTNEQIGIRLMSAIEKPK